MQNWISLQQSTTSQKWLFNFVYCVSNFIYIRSLAQYSVQTFVNVPPTQLPILLCKAIQPIWGNGRAMFWFHRFWCLPALDTKETFRMYLFCSGQTWRTKTWPLKKIGKIFAVQKSSKPVERFFSKVSCSLMSRHDKFMSMLVWDMVESDWHTSLVMKLLE